MKLNSIALPQLPTWNGRKLLSLSGYAAFFFFFFMLFSYWSFPYGRVRDFVVRTVQERLGYQLTIGELSPHWLTGVHLSEVKLTKPAVDAKSEPANLVVEEATISVSVWPLLVGKTVLSFWASTGDGSIEGDYSQSGEAFDVEAELDALDLGALGAGEWIGLPLRGEASGELSLNMPDVGTEPALNGTVTIASLALGDGKAKLKLPGLRDGFTVERIDAGALTLQVASENGVATIKQLSAQGADVKLRGEGTMRIARPLERSRGDFTLGVTFTDKYKNRNDRTKALFQLLDFQPELKRATSDDGTLSFRLVGPLSTIRAVPAGSAIPEDSPARKTRSRRRTRGT